MPVQVSLLTPRGRGAVATIGVRGTGALDLVASRFGPAAGQPLNSRPGGSVAFGRFRLVDFGAEEVVAGVLSPEEIEVHCHGGVAVAEAVCCALVAGGAERVAWEDWLRQSQPDAIAAAALAALPLARTERTAAILLDQYRGGLRTELAVIDDLLQQGQPQSAAERIRRLLAWQDVGLHLTQPWRVVLTGRPNAGKSSLLNALVGFQRAIVFAEPGTTRDVLTATTAIDGWPVELADTAGLRAAEGEIEAAGVSRAVQAIALADLVLLVADTTSPWDAALHDQVESKSERALIVHNKCDLQAPDPTRPPGIAVSAKTGAGLPALLAAVCSALVPQAPTSATPLPFTRDQIAALHSAKVHSSGGNIVAARTLLASCLRRP